MLIISAPIQQRTPSMRVALLQGPDQDKNMQKFALEAVNKDQSLRTSAKPDCNINTECKQICKANPHHTIVAVAQLKYFKKEN